MKKIAIISFALFLFALTGFAQQKKLGKQKIDKATGTVTDTKYPYIFRYKGNPLVSHISSTDPDVNVWDGVVWMYCSQDHQQKPGEDHPYYNMDGYHAFSSKDLINWTDHGEVIHSRDIGWGTPGWMWAPAAARKDGKYYLYYPHRDTIQKVWLIGVAVADHPTGPFKDIGKPIKGLTGMDPKVFIDDDGEVYIYSNVAKVTKMKPNMIEIAEPSRTLKYAPKDIMDNNELRLGEGPHMLKKDGVYYYSYSNPRNQTNQAFYATGTSPFGPFEWKGAFAPVVPNAQDHHSIFEFKGEWYYFYHINTPKEVLDAMGWKGIRRIACYEKFYFNADGSFKMVEHTRKKVK